AERFAKNRQVVRQVTLFHDGIGPDAPEYFVLADELAVIFDENPKSVEYLRAERDRMAATEQPPLSHLQSKWAKFVYALHGDITDDPKIPFCLPGREPAVGRCHRHGSSLRF